jgi:hypothetical protein
VVVEIGEWYRPLAEFYEAKVYETWWSVLYKKETWGFTCGLICYMLK